MGLRKRWAVVIDLAQRNLPLTSSNLMAEVLLLGAAQDAGIPQPGCNCSNCEAAWADPANAEDPACLAVVDREAASTWLIDCTPAFPRQLKRLQNYAPDCPVRGFLLTHAHMGHYTGLIYLGLEAMNTTRLPIYATASMAAFLAQNGPWSQLILLGNIELHTIEPEVAIALTDRIRVTPIRVPHRAEFSDTLAYRIEGPGRSLFYCPDIDDWETWECSISSLAAETDYLLVDGTFFSPAELPGRNLDEIPHPCVTDTCGRLVGLRVFTTFIHLNHSNPLLQDGAERQWLIAQGHAVGRSGSEWCLD